MFPLWGWLSSGGTGLVSSVPSPLCRSPLTKICPGRYPTSPGHRGLICYQRGKVQSLKHRDTANMPMWCIPCWSFAKFIALNVCSVGLVPEEHRDCHPAANSGWPHGIHQWKDLNKVYMVEYFLLRQLIDWLCRNLGQNGKDQWWHSCSGTRSVDWETTGTATLPVFTTRQLKQTKHKWWCNKLSQHKTFLGHESVPYWY